mmetsp:Transcript_16295/g.35225  ORF Transcript_16295/g.35225 Transcript_16295/m.35225 type:complete len:682 (+) Transcript_16295:136-2181(+)
MKLFGDKFRSWFRKLNTAGDDQEQTGSDQGTRQPVLESAQDPVACSQHSERPPATKDVRQQQAVLPAESKQEQQSKKALSEATGQQPAADKPASQKPNMLEVRDFFAEYGEANRYSIREVIGKGSYGIVCSAVDNYTGEKVAIKKITNVFEHVSDATRILREIKLLRLLKHPDIVEIKHIMLPPTPRDYKDIYVVFELMETDLHQVIKANDDLTPEHHQFFLYQMLRGLKFIHSAKVFHRDLKPKNILANSDCKLKICDFGLARPAFNDQPTTIFWTDYVATRWYRAPELCGSFFAKYSPAIDLWSVGCIFAEVLLGKPLFPGRNVVHQLELITDLLGTPSQDVINKVRNEKARRFLNSMRKKPPVPFELFFPRADPAALALLRRLLAFDPAERPAAEEALADPYFAGLHVPSREPCAQPISKLAFEFDRRKLSIEDVRDLIYREILEYHPMALEDYLTGSKRSSFANPSALENFKRQFMHLEANPGAVLETGPRKNGSVNGGPIQPATSLPKEWISDEPAPEASVPPPRPKGATHGGSVSSQAGAGGTGTTAAAAPAAGQKASGLTGAAAVAAARGVPPSRYLMSQISAPMPRGADITALTAEYEQTYEHERGSRNTGSQEPSREGSRVPSRRVSGSQHGELPVASQAVTAADTCGVAAAAAYPPGQPTAQSFIRSESRS